MVVDTDQQRIGIESSNRAPDAERHVEEHERVSGVVVALVAEVLDRDPAELPPLYGSVDLEALDDLFGSRYDGTSRLGGRVEFTHGECDVVVERDRVQVYCD